MLSRAEKAIVAVIAYSAQFDHPLTLSQIYERLLTAEGLRLVDEHFPQRKLSWKTTPLTVKEQLAGLLRALVQKRVLIEQRGLFTLAGRPRALTKRRLSAREKRAKEALIQELVVSVRRIPWVLGVAVTGSYAAGGAADRDDVDFLMITQANRLWLTRLLMLLQAWRRGRRLPLPNGDISHSWDLNLWLDETRLALPKRRQSVYEAYEVLQTRWVYERNQIRERLLLANPWLSRYLVFWPGEKLKPIANQARGIDLLAWLDSAAFALEIGYRTLRHGRQRATLHSAFFHPAKTRQNIFKAWKKLYSRAISAQKLVLVTGVFDVLHQEHQHFLKAAKRAGDVLIVGLESDKRVREIKGKGRPVNPQKLRKQRLEQWQIADTVFILPENFGEPAQREALIRDLRPDILAVSSHTPHLERKRQILRRYGGEVKVVRQFNPKLSSTKLLKARQKK